jgi:hypothetical protein
MKEVVHREVPSGAQRSGELVRRKLPVVDAGWLRGRGGGARWCIPCDGDAGVRRQPKLAGDREVLTVAWSEWRWHILGTGLETDGGTRRSSTQWWLRVARWCEAARRRAARRRDGNGAGIKISMSWEDGRRCCARLQDEVTRVFRKCKWMMEQ